MARRMSPSQLRSKLRQIQSKQRQAINRYNQKVRQINQARQRAINNYNREVRAYNQRLRQNQQRLRAEYARLQAQGSPRHLTYRTSVQAVHKAYVRLETSAEGRATTPEENLFLDFSEREAANALGTYNLLTESDPTSEPELVEGKVEESAISEELSAISNDLNDRWLGALFSLHPNNPDSSRHFCASAREIFTQLIHAGGDDDEIIQALEDCELTDKGKPTRRSRLRYMLLRQGMAGIEQVDFMEADIDDVLQLFDDLQAGTHGAAGRYDLRTLLLIKRRVEDALAFLCRLAA